MNVTRSKFSAGSPDRVREIAQFIAAAVRRSNFTGLTINFNDPAAAGAILAGLPNLWIVDGRFRNLAISELNGFDLSIDNAFETSWGSLDVGGQLTKIFDYRQQTTENAPMATVVDVILRPIPAGSRFLPAV